MDVTLISRFFDARNTGIGSYSKLTYESLNSRGINVNKISQDESIMPPQYIGSYFFYYAIDLKRILMKNEYKNSDIYHSLNPLESFHIPKNKSVSTILDFIPLEKENLSFFDKIFYKSILSSIECERIVVINPDLKDTLISKYNVEESSIDIIPPCIDNKYYPDNKSHDEYTIGTICGLFPRKRIDVLIKSFLQADIENSKLLIGGTGMELENLKNLANGDDRIEFLGFVPDDKMNEFYNKLDVFVFPTLVEGYGMPIIEAMACGKPVVVLEDADMPDFIKKRCTICSEEKLYEVLEERKFSCDIKSNINFSKEHSIENTGLRLMKVYESI